MEVRSQRGEKGSPSSASLSPCRGTECPQSVPLGGGPSPPSAPGDTGGPYLPEELLHQRFGPAAVHCPLLGGVADVGRVQQQRKHLGFVDPGEGIRDSTLALKRFPSPVPRPQNPRSPLQLLQCRLHGFHLLEVARHVGGQDHLDDQSPQLPVPRGDGAVRDHGDSGDNGGKGDNGAARAMGPTGMSRTMGIMRTVGSMGTVRAMGAVGTRGPVGIMKTVGSMGTVRAMGTVGTRGSVGMEGTNRGNGDGESNGDSGNKGVNGGNEDSGVHGDGESNGDSGNKGVNGDNGDGGDGD